jgi:hypothetical protein
MACVSRRYLVFDQQLFCAFAGAERDEALELCLVALGDVDGVERDKLPTAKLGSRNLLRLVFIGPELVKVIINFRLQLVFLLIAIPAAHMKNCK